MRFEDDVQYAGRTDEQLIEYIRAGRPDLYELLVRRHDQRLYRIVRSILRDDTEAEDVMQDAFLLAWENLQQFRGDATFATWLTRIATNEALARVKRRRLWYSVRSLTDVTAKEIASLSSHRTPEHELAAKISIPLSARLLKSFRLYTGRYTCCVKSKVLACSTRRVCWA
jgi:DNA-directed RNA polymerase specialized sigma24 family protein